MSATQAGLPKTPEAKSVPTSEPIFPAGSLEDFELNPKIKDKLKKPYNHFIRRNDEFQD